ncbi:MAG: hypothetical protein P8X69_03915, partial [Maritimibacter sp.]
MSDENRSDTPETGQADPAPRKRGWRPRKLHFHLSFWTLLSSGLIAVILLLASMSATGRMLVLPNWAAQTALDKINNAVPEFSFSLRQAEFGIMPDGRPMIRLVDLGVKDAAGLELARLNGVESGFGIGAALLGRFEPTLLRLQGAQMTVRRLSDGTFALSLGQSSGTTGSFAAMLDSLDATFDEGFLDTASRIEANDLTLTLEDATTELSFRSSRVTSEASISARFDNAAARDIAAQTPALSFLSVIDAPISGALRSSFNREGAIADLAGTLKIGSGALSPTPGAKPAEFNGAQIYIDFDPDAQRIDFQGASIQSELGTASADGHVYLTDFNGPWPNSMIGQITLNGGELNPGAMFSAPLTIDNGRADIRLSLSPFRIDIGQAV